MAIEGEDLHAEFNYDEWINTGKFYDHTTPGYVVLELKKQVKVPCPTCSFKRSTMFLPPTASVTDFIAWKVPHQSSELIASKAVLWFSSDPLTPTSWYSRLMLFCQWNSFKVSRWQLDKHG